MTDGNMELSRRKILGAAGAVGAAGAAAGLGTSALFSDEESFVNNSITAGTLDLKVSWDEHYFNGIRNLDNSYNGDIEFDSPGSSETGFPSSSGSPYLAVADGEVGTFMGDTRTEQFPDGGLGSDEDPCEELADVPGAEIPPPVIDLDDVKPGDFGEVTFDFSLCDNPGYLWMTGDLVSESENGVTEPEGDSSEEDQSFGNASLWPLAALAAVPALGGDDDGDDGDSGGSQASVTADTGTTDDDAGTSDRRSALRKGAAAAGAGAAGLGAASGLASADSGKGSPPDPNPNNDVSIDNGTLSVSVDEQGSSGFAFGGDGSTVFAEKYGFRDGSSGTHVASTDGSVSVTDPFPSSVSPGTTASSTLDYPVPTPTPTGPTTVNLEVKRKATLDTSEPILRVEYEVTNPSGSGATFSDLRLSQYVDYDIGGISNNIGRYFLDSTTGCEFIWQETEGGDIFAGFTAEEQSVSHGLTTYSIGTTDFDTNDISSILNEDDVHPDTGTTDVELTFEWSLGELAPGETTTFRTSFVYNDQGRAEFENQICQESPGTPTPTPTPSPGESELVDKVQARAWYDGGGGDGPSGDVGDNINQDDEQVFLEGTLREVLDGLSSGKGVPLDGDESTNTDFNETSDPPNDADRDCYTAADDVHYIGFEWWVPRSVGNEIQSDSVTFDLGFYTEQCRNNDGSGGSGDGGDGSADPLVINDQTANDP
jgi:predicted ribosomally synthesized peptide with SipW-like signal peptide